MLIRKKKCLAYDETERKVQKFSTVSADCLKH